MKKITIIVLLTSLCGFLKAQNDTTDKKKYYVESWIIHYDMNGNQYSVRKEYYNEPTAEDSVLFQKEESVSINNMMDSVGRKDAIYSKYIDSINKINYRKQKNYAPLFPREGKHLFSLHWISESKFGAVVIKKINQQKYSVKGNQRDEKGNFVTIDGYLKPINKGEMKFYGEIQSKVSGNNNGKVCVKKGEYTFLCKRGRKYWRLQEMKDCEGGEVVDYIDIFF